LISIEGGQIVDDDGGNHQKSDTVKGYDEGVVNQDTVEEPGGDATEMDSQHIGGEPTGGFRWRFSVDVNDLWKERERGSDPSKQSKENREGLFMDHIRRIFVKKKKKYFIFIP
jgi:hypothetical protein